MFKMKSLFLREGKNGDEPVSLKPSGLSLRTLSRNPTLSPTHLFALSENWREKRQQYVGGGGDRVFLKKMNLTSNEAKDAGCFSFSALITRILVNDFLDHGTWFF